MTPFEFHRIQLLKKLAQGYVRVWNHRKGRFDLIRKAQEK